MVTAYDVPPNELLEVVKEELKQNEKIVSPEWMLFAKSGVSRERPPAQDDFWQIRGAALLRKLYVKGPLGVSRLKTEYGARKNRGSKPGKHSPASGNVLRTLLQQLEEAGYVKKDKKGRSLTPAGQKFLDASALKVSKAEK